jgi:exodeoxyribonuclease VII large subunit
MVRLAAARAECDVLIIARGGGSLEDLWAFNEEAVARAIFDCPIPIVSGVGHETDVTMTDFAADVRAPTPTGAAELVAPDQAEWLRRLEHDERRLVQAALSQLGSRGERLAWCRRRLTQLHPDRQIKERIQRLDELEQRLAYVTRNLVAARRVRLAHLAGALRRASPQNRLAHSREQVEALRQRLINSTNQSIAVSRQRLAVAARALDTISPLATLTRGYAIVSDAETGAIIRRADEVPPGRRIKARLNQGSLVARVESEES